MVVAERDVELLEPVEVLISRVRVVVVKSFQHALKESHMAHIDEDWVGHSPASFGNDVVAAKLAAVVEFEVAAARARVALFARPKLVAAAALSELVPAAYSALFAWLAVVPV